MPINKANRLHSFLLHSARVLSTTKKKKVITLLLMTAFCHYIHLQQQRHCHCERQQRERCIWKNSDEHQESGSINGNANITAQMGKAATSLNYVASHEVAPFHGFVRLFFSVLLGGVLSQSCTCRYRKSTQARYYF